MPSTLLTQNYEQARDELARAIRTHRPECSPHELAWRLLEYNHPGHTTFVGIDVEARRAVLYHEQNGYMIAVVI